MSKRFAMKWIGVALVVLITACAPDKEGIPSAKPSATIPTVRPDDLTSRDCFDVKMETWFVAFDKYQREGNKMGVADAKAWTEAERAFTECSGNIAEKLTSRAKE